MKKKILAGILAGSLLFTLAGCGAATTSVSAAEGEYVELTTPSGPIRGIAADGISVYKGIPFANPPERFAPPEDVTPWTETRDCTAFGPTPVQATPREGQPMSEDCLYMNIWTPATSAGEKLPVYVWIYGGAFAQGSGSEAAFDGTTFAKDGVVLVTFNYRVNALGFFASDTTYDEYGTTGNWGLLDQIKALEWVQKNIAAFGGDPNTVTVGGESAGSYSTSALIQSPLAAGLFQRAIMESGSVLGVPGNNSYARGNLERSITQSGQLAFLFGADDTPAGLATLRAADASVFSEMSPLEVDFTKNPAYMMLPVFDGTVLDKDFYNAVAGGNVNQVDLLWGYNGNEGSVFIPEGQDQASYEALACRMYGYAQGQKVLARFPVDDTHTATDRARQIFAYGMFSGIMKPFGDTLAGGNNVYAYMFNYASAAAIENGLGASHGSEIAYAFGNFSDGPAGNPTPTDDEKHLSAEMHARWVNFIKTGDPNNGALPTSDVAWPQYDTANPEMFFFDTTLTAGAMPEADDIAFMLDIMFGPGGTYI